MAAQPAEPNAVMEAWMTVLKTGVSPKEDYVSPTTASIIAFAGKYIITGGLINEIHSV